MSNGPFERDTPLASQLRDAELESRTHRTYEPAWLTEATFELESLVHDCDYYTVDGVCQYCMLGSDEQVTE